MCVCGSCKFPDCLPYEFLIAIHFFRVCYCDDYSFLLYDNKVVCLDFQGLLPFNLKYCILIMV